MTLWLRARVEVTATVVGTGPVTNIVANTSRIDFSTMPDGDFTYGYLQQGALWEECTLTKSGVTMVRSAVTASSSGGASVGFDGTSSSTAFIDVPLKFLLVKNAAGGFDNADPLLATVTVDTVAALKAVEIPATSGLSRRTRGSVSATDGKGGWYYWDAADATAGDDYNFIVSNLSATGRWIRMRQHLDPASAANDAAIASGAIARVSSSLRSIHPINGALAIPETVSFLKAIFDSYAAFKAVASTTWANNDRLGFNGITGKNDAPYHEAIWNAASTNIDALDSLFIRPTDITASNPGRAQFIEPAPIAVFADADPTPSVKAARHFRASNIGTTITALDDAIDLQVYTIFPGLADTQFTHSATFVMPGAANFVLQTTANGGAPVQIVYENGVGYLIGGGVSLADLNAAINALIDASPAALDTLNELAAALGDDANFAATVTNALAAKVAGPASAVDLRIAAFDGTTGKLIKDGGKTIAQLDADIALKAPLASPVFPDGLTVDGPDTLVKPTVKLRQASAPTFGYDVDLESASVGRLDIYAVSSGVRTRALSVDRSTASVDLKNVPTAPTAAVGTNTTQVATTAFATAAKNSAIAQANLIVNPLFEDGLAPHAIVTELGGTWSVVAPDPPVGATAKAGIKVLRFNRTTSGPGNSRVDLNGSFATKANHPAAAEGDVFTASVWVRLASGVASRVQIAIQPRQSGTATALGGNSSAFITPTATWQKITVTATAGAAAGAPTAYVQVWLLVEDSANVGVVDFDVAELRKENVVSAAATIAALKALPVVGFAGGALVSVMDLMRGGAFLWTTGDQSTNVTNDPGEGIWIAPNSAATGASGAWRRRHDPGEVWSNWFGVVSDWDDVAQTGTDNFTAFSNLKTYVTNFVIGTSTSDYPTIRIQPGQMKVGGELDFNLFDIEMIGAGPADSKLYFHHTSGACIRLRSSWSRIERIGVYATTVRKTPVYAAGKTVSASDTTAETLTVTAHGYSTRNIVKASATSAGLTAGTEYVVEVIDANTVKLHTTQRSIIDASAVVNITAAPSGLSLQKRDLSGVGIGIIPTDEVGGTAKSVRIVDCIIQDQPSVGVYNAAANVLVEDCDINGCLAHGYMLDAGRFLDRTNLDQRGWSTIRDCRVQGNGGHNIVFGHPADVTGALVFRASAENNDCGAPSANQLFAYENTNSWFNGAQIELTRNAFGGNDTMTGAFLAGEAVVCRLTRIIDCTKAFIVDNTTLGTLDLRIDAFRVIGSPASMDPAVELRAGITAAQFVRVDNKILTGITNLIGGAGTMAGVQPLGGKKKLAKTILTASFTKTVIGIEEVPGFTTTVTLAESTLIVQGQIEILNNDGATQLFSVEIQVAGVATEIFAREEIPAGKRGTLYFYGELALAAGSKTVKVRITQGATTTGFGNVAQATVNAIDRANNVLYLHEYTP